MVAPSEILPYNTITVCRALGDGSISEHIIKNEA